jgi:hypothetical protein
MAMRVFTSDRYLMRGHGGGIIFDHDAHVRGKGIASVFSQIYSSVLPYIKKALEPIKRIIKTPAAKKIKNEIKKSASKASLNVVSDALEGKNVIKASKRELVKAKDDLKKTIQNIASEPLVKKAKMVKPAKQPVKKEGPISFKTKPFPGRKLKKPKPKVESGSGRAKKLKKKISLKRQSKKSIQHLFNS